MIGIAKKALSPGAAFLFLAAFSAGARAEVEDLAGDAGKGDRESKLPTIAEIASNLALDALDTTFELDGWDVRIAMAPGTMPEIAPKAGDPPEFSHTAWRILYADFQRTKAKAILPEYVDAGDGERLVFQNSVVCRSPAF